MACYTCGRPLTSNEEGLSRKLINRGTDKLYCYACLSKSFRVPEEKLREMVVRFREAGCTLFR